MKNTLKVIYFGGSVGIYLNNELYAYRPYTNIEELFNRSLELMKEDISSVEKYGIPEESYFWDTVNYSSDWIPPEKLDSLNEYLIPV